MLERLRTFSTVVRCGSFTAAAKELLLTPAAVMRQVNQLECDTGVPLVERSKRGVTPTLAGERLAMDAGAIETLVDEALRRARAASSIQGSRVTVGYSLLNPANSFIERWGRVGAAHPDIAVQMVPFLDDPERGQEAYGSIGRELDFIVGPYDTELHPGIRGLELARTWFGIGLPTGDSLVGEGMLDLGRLEGRTLMLSRRGSVAEVDRVRDYLRREYPGIALHDLPQNYGSEVFNLCVATGNPLLTLDCWRSVHPGVVTLPVDWEFSLPLGVMHAAVPRLAAREVLRVLGEEGGDGGTSGLAGTARSRGMRGRF